MHSLEEIISRTPNSKFHHLKVAVILLGLLTACSEYGRKYEVNQGEVFYKSPVTKAQAQSLGDYFVAEGYFDGTPSSVQLLKKGDGYRLRFVVQEGTEKDLDYLYIFRHLAGLVSSNVLDAARVDVDLCDRTFSTVHEIQGIHYGTKLELDGNSVYFTEPVSDQEARRFGEYLREAGFFSGNGFMALLKKDKSGFQFHYPVKEILEDTAGYFEAVKIVAGSLSRDIFEGQKVSIHLCDEYFNVENVITSHD
jgi:hypothetical protein